MIIFLSKNNDYKTNEKVMIAAMRRAGLAQLVEHLICNQGVGGSSPSTGTTIPKISNVLSRFERLSHRMTFSRPCD